MNELIDRIAFAIQEEGMTRIQAQRITSKVLAALHEGDVVSDGLMVRSSVTESTTQHSVHDEPSPILVRHSAYRLR